MIDSVYQSPDYRLYKEVYRPSIINQSAGYVSGRVSYFTSPIQGTDWAYKLRFTDAGKCIYFVVTVDIQLWIGPEVVGLPNGTQIYIVRGDPTSAVDIRPYDSLTTIINEGKIRYEFSSATLTKIDKYTWMLTGKIA